MKESFVKSLCATSSASSLLSLFVVPQRELSACDEEPIPRKPAFLRALRSNHSAVGVFAYTDFAKRFHNPDLSRRFVTTRLALKKAINLPDRA